MRMRLEDLPPALQKQALAQLHQAESEALEQIEIPPPLNKHELKLEKDLQHLCENWLHLHGYMRMTADNAMRPPPERGWFGHWFNSIRNPLWPDLAILDLTGRCLLVELKTRDVWQPGQKQMVESGFWKVAWSFADLQGFVLEWEK